MLAGAYWTCITGSAPGSTVRDAPRGAEGKMNTDAHLLHPRLRINRVLRVLLHTRWSEIGNA
jgi:hypothetical protein